MRTFYVTVHLTNGGIDSLYVDINDDETIQYETFEGAVRKYVETKLKPEDPELRTMGHIIAWSEVKIN